MIRSISKMFAASRFTVAEKQDRQNIPTPPRQTGDPRIWQPKPCSDKAKINKDPQSERPSGIDVYQSISPDVLQTVRQTLIEQETAFQHQWTEETFSSLWAHSSRVGRIAVYIADKEGCPTEPALLAGLFHDMGKFAHGRYHHDDTPEEKNAVLLAEQILRETVYEKWIPTIEEAILSCYLDGEATNDIGRIVFDADCLDKLGNMGVAQFFAKKAMRRQFLDDQLMIRMSVELTYAYHAPETLKTVTGRVLAKQRSHRTRRFYTELVEEWTMLGLGDVTIMEEDVGGIVCVFVVPRLCTCGGLMACESDIRDAVKCRSAVVTYRCVDCAAASEFSFCLPNISGLPRKSQRRLVSCA